MADLDRIGLCDILALSWIFVGVPSFMFVLLWLMRRDPQTVHCGSIIARVLDMPAMVAVALAGWISVAPRMRMQVLLLWIAFPGGSLALLNLIRDL